jgi:polyphenol oxidase
VTLIHPNWPAPKNIQAYTSTLCAGNLATHVPRPKAEALENRARFEQDINTPNPIQWLTQTHSTDCIILPQTNNELNADASITSQPNTVAAVLTADCLPLLLCNLQGSEVAAVHAGWRGLLNGIIQNTINTMNTKAQDLLVWLGPAIGPSALRLNADIRADFINANPLYEQGFFQQHDHWHADLYQLARIALNSVGVQAIFGGDYCTFNDTHLFYSYRRCGTLSGRIASVIWIDAP